MSNTLDSSEVREKFPTLSEIVYLNNASTGIMPAATVDAMKDYLINRVNMLGKFDETLSMYKEIRQALADLLGGREDQYGFVPSTSAGINSLGHSISYPRDSNIVVCDLEFPANYVPWQNVRRLYDVELRVAKSNDGAIPIERFKELIDNNTRVVAVSQVQFGSGYRTDLKRLAALIHSVGGYLVADIIQAAGWADTNLVAEDVDFATAQAAKWLVGPIGAGFVYVSDRIINDLVPRFLGWWGVKGITDFEYKEREPLKDAKKFQVGSPSGIAYRGFLESLKILLEIRGKTRERIALDNANYLRKRLEEIGVSRYDFGPNNSPIVSCVPENVEELQKRLHEKNIRCSVRNGRLRVSPHFYNTYEEIDIFIDHLG
ncbi:MAG: aminotransferase class V-fold PLP-dependent enzyme [Candidatus Hodarchaeota archaeon]